MITHEIIAYIFISAVIAFLAYCYGSKKGSFDIRKKLEREAELNTVSTLAENNRLKKEVDVLTHKLNQYLNFFIRIPQAVKNINSHLSFDDLITSIMRLVKELIDTDQIEIYKYDKQRGALKLIAAMGTNRGESIEFRLGEGVVGCAAELQMFFTYKELKADAEKSSGEKILSATPITTGKELFGVIGIGKINTVTENDKRFLAMIADLSAVAVKNCEYLDSAKEEAVKDVVTGLHNRQYFFENGQTMLQKSGDYDHPFSIFLFDIDNFKFYNDANGNISGDKLLQAVGIRVKEKTRATNIVAKYGDDEFIILFQNTDMKEALEGAEKIRTLIESSNFPYSENQPLGCVSISGGVATFPINGNTLNDLIKHADEALLASKENGKNCITQYEPLMK